MTLQARRRAGVDHDPLNLEPPADHQAFIPARGPIIAALLYFGLKQLPPKPSHHPAGRNVVALIMKPPNKSLELPDPKHAGWNLINEKSFRSDTEIGEVSGELLPVDHPAEKILFFT